MESKRNNIGQTIFICFGGLLIGGLLGGLAGVYGFAALLPKSNNYSLGEGFGVGIAIMFAGIAGLVLGGIIGAFLFLILSKRQALRIYLTGVSGLVCIAGVFGITKVYNDQSSQEVKAKQYGIREQARLQTLQAQGDANSAAYLKQAPIDVPPLLGNLYYPNATIVASDQPSDPTYSKIVLSTKDNLNKVAAFYQNLVPGGVSYNHSTRGNSYEVKTIRPGDRQPITIDVESDYSSSTSICFLIDLTASNSSSTMQTTPATIPNANVPAPATATVSPSAAPDPAFLQAYGNLAYPNAIETLVAPNPPHPEIPYSNCLQATMDTYTQVVGYYQSKLNTVSQTDVLYTGTTNRSSDGRLTTITVRTGALSKTYISLTVGQ